VAEVQMHVDRARQHDLAGGVEDFGRIDAGPGRQNGGNFLAADRDVGGDAVGIRQHNCPAADEEIEAHGASAR
jgi:hypothetical protein